MTGLAKTGKGLARKAERVDLKTPLRQGLLQDCVATEKDIEKGTVETTNYGRPMKPVFSQKSQTFGLRQIIWSDKFWGILGIEHHKQKMILIWIVLQV